MQIKKIKINGKTLKVEECKTILQKTRGLMFRKKSKPLLFKFNRPVSLSIHSFFCKPFKAIWLINGKIIDEKIVQPWRFSVKPKRKFTEILEIPL